MVPVASPIATHRKSTMNASSQALAALVAVALYLIYIFFPVCSRVSLFLHSGILVHACLTLSFTVYTAFSRAHLVPAPTCHSLYRISGESVALSAWWQT